MKGEAYISESPWGNAKAITDGAILRHHSVPAVLTEHILLNVIYNKNEIIK